MSFNIDLSLSWFLSLMCSFISFILLLLFLLLFLNVCFIGFASFTFMWFYSRKKTAFQEGVVAVPPWLISVPQVYWNISSLPDSCPSGQERLSSTADCTLCPLGEYREAGLGSFNCEQCPANTTTTAEGSVSEANCSRGLSHVTWSERYSSPHLFQCFVTKVPIAWGMILVCAIHAQLEASRTPQTLLVKTITARYVVIWATGELWAMGHSLRMNVYVSMI
jgi:hypothetical protein